MGNPIPIADLFTKRGQTPSPPRLHNLRHRLQRLPPSDVALHKCTSSKALSEKCFDITDFLSKELESSNVNFKPLNKKVLVHYPCSQKYHMNDRENTVSILKKIPELEIDSMLDLTSCCGASGLYMFNEKSTSKKLLNTLLDEIKKRNIDTLVTSNIGCLLHFQAGINQLGLKTKVIHPVSLIAEQIE